jgi:WD40 repeat protein
LASGQLRLVPLTAADRSNSPLAFFGHRGRVTAAALNGGRGLAATGGADGIVRLWDIASGAPTGVVMQPAAAPVALVALSADGRYVASAAARTVRVATVADGRLMAEVEADGVVTVIRFAPDAASVAVGDAAGVVHVAPFADSRERATVRLGAAPTSLAFTPDGSRLAAGEAGGAITLIATAAGTEEGTARYWSQPLRWLEFSPDGSALLAATDVWLHSLDATTLALAPVHSELVAWPAANTVLTAISSTVVGFAGVATDGSLASGVLDLAAPTDGAVDVAALAERDWSAAFALRLNDNGEPMPFDP